MGADIAMAAPTSEMITGTITLPASYSLSYKQIRAIFDDGSGVTLVENASTSFALPFPSGIGATATVIASALGLGVGNSIRATLRGVSPGTLNIMLELPEAVAALLPGNTAQGITTDTEFSWTPFVDGLHMASFVPMSAGPTYYVFTMGSSAKIPDLTAQGAGLPASRDYVWGVAAFGPWESIDAVAGGKTFIPAGPVFYESGAAARQFTTHP
jgi:hypothetical protein